MQVVILVGGLGTRIRSVLPPETPKPMADVAGLPFLHRLLDRSVVAGATEFLLLCGYGGSRIREYFLDAFLGVPIVYSIEESQLGTGGALVNASEALRDEFVLANGDTYLEIDFEVLLGLLRTSHMAMTLKWVPDLGRFGAVHVADGRVDRLTEKGVRGGGLINAGVYALNKQLIAQMPSDPFSLEREFLEPKLTALRPAYLVAEGPFFDIGVPSDYESARAYFGEV